MIKCILFDRDGTLGELVETKYPQSLIPYCDVKSVFMKLKEKGYIVENLRINMDISDNDSIVINSIVYKPENSLESEKIKQELYELTLCKNIQEENHERNKS